jgi:uncharacterized membrane protein YfcA
MMDADSLALIAAGLLLAGIVKGATGIGYATFALPILANIIGLKPAMAMVVAPTLAANMSLTITAGHVRETTRNFALLYLAMLPGVAAGAALLVMVDQRVAVIVCGSLLILYSAFALMKPHLALSSQSARRLKVPVGFANGLLTGLTGSQVLPLVPYVLALQLDSARTLQTINIGVLILSSALGLSLLLTNATDPMLLLASLAGVLPALAGSAIGASLQARLNGRVARMLVLGVVALSGVRMLVG